ncbi:MAG: hypothetical protein U9N10_07860 [Bacillota bacterium]|nr:hypothetical protein [Bacillota bacterium]
MIYKGVIMKTFDINLLTIESVIQEMIDDSEMVYGFISDKLPELENQAETAIYESKQLLKKFENAEIDDENTFINLVNNLEQEMKNIYNDLVSQKNIKELLNRITSDSEDKVNFNTILKLIEELTKVFSSLEQLSINAIIFSSRLEHGEAFRVISQEINQLSKKVKEDYDIFEENIIVLRNWNKNFTGQLESLGAIENQIFDQYNKTLIKAIKDIIESLEGISMLIKDFIGQVEKSLKPIEKIIIELQGQDLIRQNMENLTEIIFTLSEAIEKFNSDDLEMTEALNTLQFIIDIGELSKNLVSNVDEQFAISINRILEQALQMDEILEVINNEGTTLWDFMVEGIQTGTTVTSSIDKKNAIVIDETISFEDKTNKIISGYSKLDESDDILNEYLGELENDFARISKMAGRFSRIKLLAKIEFARLNRNDTGHIENIEKIIDVFIDFTEENQEVFNQIEKTLVKDIRKFSIFREQISEDLYKASDTIENSKEELRTVKNAVKSTIAELINITSSLYEDVHFIISEFESFGDMSSKINKIQDILDQSIIQAVNIKEVLLEKHDLETWQSTNDYYEAIEAKFTSYIERKTANETFGSDDVDAGSEGGELTLF